MNWNFGLLFTGDWLPREGMVPDLPDGVVSVGNLECAFTDEKIASGKAYTSVVSLTLLDVVAKSGFSALSVANNHAYDAGEIAFDSVMEKFAVIAPGVQIFGTVDRPYATLGNVVVVGCLECCRSRGPRIFKEEDVLDLIKRLKGSATGVKRVLVYPHWGKEGEYTRYPSPAQRKLAMKWIEAGADAVIGSHSHVPQGREYFRGKPIYYSLGNFDFEHPESKLYQGTSDRVMVSITFAQGDGSPEVEEMFNSDAARESVEMASASLDGWSKWKWAKAVGPFNISKNMASWRIRLKRDFVRTLPKFIIWQFLPKTILFRTAAIFGRKAHSV